MSHPIPVNLLPMPAEAGRAEVLGERRRYSRELAQAALRTVELYEAAYVDPLTGLGNRRMLDEKLPKLFRFAEGYGLPIALAFADIRGLKRTNDKDGHEVGDRLIKAGAAAFSSILRDGDLAIHLGGDEFVGVFMGYTPKKDQTPEELDNATINRLTESFDAAAVANGIPPERHVSLDVAIMTAQPGDTPESLLVRADKAMQSHKDAFYADMERRGQKIHDNRVA